MTDEKNELDSTADTSEADGKKAQLIRNLIVVLVFGSAITLGYFVELPVWSFAKDKKEHVVEREKEIRGALNAKNRLTVMNAMVDGNPDSEKLKKILEKLIREKYHAQVAAVELDVEEQTTLSKEHAIDLKKFAGQLDFYAEGYKLGTLKGETDPVEVEKAIDYYLAGLVKRFGPDWLPKVDGMKRVGTSAPTSPAAAVPGVVKPNPQPIGVPGMERTGSGVPGMTRAKPGQSTIQVKPAETPKE